MITTNKILSVVALLLVALSSCNKSNYQDGGVLDPQFKGSSYDYIVSKPAMFDSLTKIVRLAGMEQALKSEELTFFAPPSQTVMATIRLVNIELRRFGRDTVYDLRQIKPAVWKKLLTRYIFKHKRSLTDYPQVDFFNIPVFPGQPYLSYNNDVMNIGVMYADAGGVEYAGQRTLYLSFIQSLSSPNSSWINASVATSNVATNNGYVHVLRFAATTATVDLTPHYFGFNPFLVYNEALDQGIDR
ncbi:hypothetical protein [Paraflavitalea pollutisoli]|uniref:hypothetical protein n=1 Tax=Paraflavitalea pollutisoli TaxID=3034143 RepID=UPI0023ED254A|nr:hypothetical protein [Paraflavitalea sp. H1-2-19X]